MNEQDLNLTIALACRDRLQQYQGVDVYMTREDGSCPDAEHQGEYCIEKRTGYATDLGADLFVSLHNNGTTGVYGAEANGTEVYVSNYSAYTEKGKKLGQMVLDNFREGFLSGQKRKKDIMMTAVYRTGIISSVTVWREDILG